MVKVKGHGSRSKVKGHGSRSKVKVKFMVVNIRGPALPSAAKSNKSHYQSEVFVIRGVYG